MAQKSVMKIPLWGAGDRIVAWAKVSAADFVWLNDFRWNLLRGGYAYRREYSGGGPGVVVYMHRVIMGLQSGDGRQVDHMNRDKLDNRRRNLRIVLRSQQAHNMMRVGNFTSKFRGVSWDARTKRWEAYVHRGGRKFHIGRFEVEEDAAAAARASRLELLSHALD